MFQRSDIRKELENILLEIADRHGFQIYEMSIEEDHVHIFLGHRPSQSIAEVIQYLKGASSRELRKVFPELKGYDENHLWSAGKCFRPIGEITPEKVNIILRNHKLTTTQIILLNRWLYKENHTIPQGLLKLLYKTLLVNK